jgi:hypothetical protein
MAMKNIPYMIFPYPSYKPPCSIIFRGDFPENSVCAAGSLERFRFHSAGTCNVTWQWWIWAAKNDEFISKDGIFFQQN